jgi:hypothetical protein
VATNRDEGGGAGDALAPAEAQLLGDVRALIEAARQRVAAAVNQELTLL